MSFIFESTKHEKELLIMEWLLLATEVSSCEGDDSEESTGDLLKWDGVSMKVSDEHRPCELAKITSLITQVQHKLYLITT